MNYGLAVNCSHSTIIKKFMPIYKPVKTQSSLLDSQHHYYAVRLEKIVLLPHT